MQHSLALSGFRQMFVMPWALFFPLIPIAVCCSLGLLYAPGTYQTPEQIPYWTLIFGLPHIISSFQTSCDKEYLQTYGPRLLPVIGLMLAPIIFYFLQAPPKIILGINFVWTIYHVIAQQYGIAFGTARVKPSPLSSLCKWCTVLLGLIAYMQVTHYPDWENNGLSGMQRVLSAAIPLLLAGMIAAGGILLWRARAHRTGMSLLGLNLLLFLLALFLIFGSAHALIGLMIIRILHDVTGFMAYIWHDSIRNRPDQANPLKRPNLLYRLFPFVPVWLLNPVLAIAIAAGLAYGAQDVTIIWWLMIGLNIAHYYMESFIWKQGTPHRQHFSMA